MLLSEEERQELLEAAGSQKLREDFERLRFNRYNPFEVNNEVDINKLLEFLNDWNEFINHEPKPFRRIIDKDMRL